MTAEAWKVYIVVGYLAGAALTPFVLTLVDGPPFVKPQVDSWNLRGLLVISLFWPIGLVAWLFMMWASLMSKAGVSCREAIDKWFERIASDAQP